MNQFIWSNSSKIDAIAFAADPSLPTGSQQSNANHRRNFNMLQEIRSLVLDGSSFQMRPGGPIAIRLLEGETGEILECATAGSSGTPKIIRRSHRSWIASFEVNAKLFGLLSTDTYAVFGSLEHSLSLYGVLEAAHIGANLCMLAGLRPDTQLELLAEKGVTTLYATPTQLEALVSAGGQGLGFEKIKRIFIGGGACSMALAEKCRAFFTSADLYPFYGASETSFITMANANTPDGSVGMAYPNVEISIRNGTGQVTNGTGEIWVRSPYLFTGYVEQIESDTKHQDGFVTVGEFGQLDEAGNLIIKGRKSRMVTVADQNVFPDETEQFLSKYFAAGPLAVVPVPDDKRGHRLAVVIVDEANKPELESAIDLCRKTLGMHGTPKYIFVAKHLPQLVSGKLDYSKITAWAEDQL